MIKIPDTILENIFKYRFEEYLKLNKLPTTGNTEDIIERIENYINTENKKNDFLEFLKEELKYGKNKQIFYKHIELDDITILNDLSKVEHFLALSNIPTTNFNNLLKSCPKNNDILFLEIEKNKKNPIKVNNIEICIYKEVQTKNNHTETHSNYVWIELNVVEQYLTVRVRTFGQPMIDRYTTKRLFHDILQQLKSIFKVLLNSKMNNAKNTLYKMYKEYINHAELPYRNKVKGIEKTISESQKDVFSALGIEHSSKLAENIIFRYSRLLERMLIIDDLDNYNSYQKNRIAIVERISVSDSTGAHANVLSGDEDGLDVANLYFDVRDTIDEIKSLNKLWIKWFKENEVISEQMSLFPNENIRKIVKQYQTRFESFKNCVIITFMKDHFVPKEVQDFVFSCFREFEN